MSALIERQADQLRRRQQYTALDKPERILSQIPKKLFHKLSKEEYYHELTQAVLYHWAVFKSAQRADESNATACHCGKLDTYTEGRAPFFCSQDLVVAADRVYTMFYQLSHERNFAGKRFIPEQTLKFLRGKMGQGVSASTVNRIFKGEFHHFWKEQLTEKDRSQVLRTVRAHSVHVANDDTYDEDCTAYNAYWGSDCGCCGDYPTICTNCSWICYWHDKKCIDCDHWYCGPDCEPGCPNE